MRTSKLADPKIVLNTPKNQNQNSPNVSPNNTPDSTPICNNQEQQRQVQQAKAQANNQQPLTSTIDNPNPSTSTTDNNQITSETKPVTAPTRGQAIAERVAETLKQITQTANEYKQQGLIRISIHRSKAFNKEETLMVMKNLGIVRTIQEDDNLIVALARTGNLHCKDSSILQIGNFQNINEDTFVKYDQETQVKPSDLNIYTNKETQVEKIVTIECGTQVNNKNIDEVIETFELTQAKNYNIPEQTMNPNMTITMVKPHNVYFNEKAFIIYTKTTVPQSIAIALSFGALSKFSLPIYYKKEDFEQLRDAAIVLNDFYSHPLEISEIMNEIIHRIEDCKESQFEQHGSEIRDFFTAAVSEMKEFCKQNPNIMVTQADKANAAVLMEKETYINKVEKHLADRTTYAPLKSSSIVAYQKMNEKILEKMVELKLMSKAEAEKAIKNETRTANMYGLIKTHKEGHPIRPIVNTKKSPGYLLAEKITSKLSTIRETHKYNVLNSREAVKKINEIKLLPDEEFASFDVISMFTNISTNAAVKAVIKRQAALNDATMAGFIEAIKFICITATEIEFNGQLYKQVKGLRMGSSISPILADFVMEDMLDTVFRKIEKPPLFMKYVDDIVTATTKEHREKIFEHLNNADENIKFEMEIEKEDKSAQGHNSPG